MRRLWILGGIALALLAILAIAGGVGAWLYREKRDRDSYAAAEHFFQEGKWFEAARNYALYLNRPKNREDIATLLKYAEASENIRSDRPKALRDAVTAYSQILRYQPNNRDIQEKLLDTLERIQSWADLEYTANNVLLRDPSNLKVQFAKARAIEGLERPDEAIAAYRALIENGTDKIETYGNLARLLKERGFEQQALQVLDDAATQHPDNARVFLERSKYFRAGGDIMASERELARALELAPDDADILLEDAEHAIMKREWDRALAHAGKVVAEHPDNPGAYILQSVTLQSKGDFPGAIAALERIPEKVRLDNQAVYYTLIEALISVNRLEEARKYLAEYQQAYPDNHAMFDYFDARQMLVTGDATGAVAKLTTLVQQRPDLAPARFLLGVAYLRTGQQDRGRATLEAYLKSYPNDDKAKALLDLESEQRLSPEKILEQAQLALADEAATPENLVAAAQMLFGATVREGKPETSVDLVKQVLEKAIERGPSLDIAYKTLSDVLVAMRDTQGAQAVLDRAVAAGVPNDQLYLNQAAIALVENNVEEARALYGKFLSKARVTADEIQGWANFFLARGYADQAVDILSQGIEKMEGVQRVTLLAEKVSMQARAGQIDQAMQLLTELQSNPDTAQTAAPGLASAKLQIAQQMLAPEKPEKLDTARRLVDEVSRTDPGNLMAQTLQAQILLRALPPDMDKARTILESVIDADDGNINALLWLAEIAVRKGESAMASDYARRVAALAPQQTSPQMRLARLQMDLKQYTDAEQTLERLLELSPDDVTIIGLLLTCYLESGHTTQAEGLLPRLEDKAAGDPKLADIVAATRGRLLISKGAPSEAEAVLREQVKKNPDDLVAVRSLAQAVDRQDRAREAEELLIDYTRKHPDKSQGWLALADFLLAQQKMDRVKDAAEALTRALLLEPNNPEALRGMITVHVRRQNPVEALALCDRYLKERPDDAGVQFQKAIILSQSPAYLPRALDAINRALTLKKEPEYVTLRGLIQLGLGQYQQAVDDLQPLANAQRVISAQTDAALAEAYLGIRNVDLARAHYESATRKAADGETVDPNRMERLKKEFK